MPTPKGPKCFPSASDSIRDAVRFVVSEQTKSKSYRLAFDDTEFARFMKSL